MRERERERERVRVAAVAQLVREERKKLEQIHPKACCPTCLYTHMQTAVCSFAYLLLCLEYSSVFSVWEMESLACGRHCLSAALGNIRHIQH